MNRIMMHQTNIDRNNTRVSECEEFLNWDERGGDGEESYNISYYTSLCNIEGKRLVILIHQYFFPILNYKENIFC